MFFYFRGFAFPCSKWNQVYLDKTAPFFKVTSDLNGLSVRYKYTKLNLLPIIFSLKVNSVPFSLFCHRYIIVRSKISNLSTKF